MKSDDRLFVEQQDSSFLPFFFFRESWSASPKMASSNHEARNSFLRSLIRARQFLLRFSSEKVARKGKRKVWMMKEKYFLKARWLRKGKWERDGRVFEERWFSMNEDWIRDERDIILLMILFQLNVNVKSRREGFGRKWFKDILRGVKNVGKFNTREYSYRIGKWRDGWRGLYVIIDDRFNSIEFWICRNVFFLVNVEKIDRGHRKWRIVIMVVIVFTVARDLSSVGRVPSVWTFRGLDRRNEIWIV